MKWEKLSKEFAEWLLVQKFGKEFYTDVGLTTAEKESAYLLDHLQREIDLQANDYKIFDIAAFNDVIQREFNNWTSQYLTISDYNYYFNKKETKRMEKLQNDLKKLSVLNEVMESIKDDIVKSISLDNKFIHMHFNEEGTLHTNERGFMGFIEAFNPKWIEKSKSCYLTVFEFYNNDIKICTLLDDEETKKFMTEFYKMPDYIKSIIKEEY